MFCPKRVARPSARFNVKAFDPLGRGARRPCRCRLRCTAIAIEFVNPEAVSSLFFPGDPVCPGILFLNMTTMISRIRPSLFLLFVFSVASGGTVPSMNITVSDAGGKIAFKGTTDTKGAFATGNLQPGNYVVQFSSNSAAVKGNQYALAVSAGKKKVAAEAVPGEKFTAGGVALKVDVEANLKIIGRVANAQVAAGPNAKMKIVNGKRYFWVEGGQTGSGLGGHWVEEGSAEALNLTRMTREDFFKTQDHGDAHQEGFPTGR